MAVRASHRHGGPLALMRAALPFPSARVRASTPQRLLCLKAPPRIDSQAVGTRTLRVGTMVPGHIMLSEERSVA